MLIRLLANSEKQERRDLQVDEKEHNVFAKFETSYLSG